MALVNRLTIVGLGLMGGSLGMAVRRHHLARCVVGYSRKASTLTEAKRRGAIDRGTRDLREAVRGSELVVLASPIDAIIPLARAIAPHLERGAVLTDVGSTKARIVRTLERLVSDGAVFVGAHPLAGSEQHGIRSARAELFAGSVCILTPTPHTDRRALRLVTRLWRPLVRQVVLMTPQTHDRYLAAVSHLPHLVAFCLMQATEPRALRVAPRSFLDATRVAKSSPDLWDDIFLSNAPATVAAIDRLERQFQHVRRLLRAADRHDLHAFLRRAQRRRTTLADG